MDSRHNIRERLIDSSDSNLSHFKPNEDLENVKVADEYKAPDNGYVRASENDEPDSKEQRKKDKNVKFAKKEVSKGYYTSDTSDHLTTTLANFKKHPKRVISKADLRNDIMERAISELRSSSDTNVAKAQFKRISAHCVAVELNVKELYKDCHSVIYGIQEINQFADVVYLTHVSEGVIYIFPFGVIVFWGFESESETYILQQIINSFAIFPLDQVPRDEMQYGYGEMTKVSNNKVILESKHSLEKLAYSYALAQSIKLSVYEEEVEGTIESTKYIPLNLAKNGRIELSKKEISKQIGALFVKRSSVNLQSDMIDTPECFWDQDEWEHAYSQMRRYLDIRKRLEVLNKRLDILKELYDMLNEELHHQDAFYLEWIVIYLIIVEVVIEVVWNILIKDILRLF